MLLNKLFRKFYTQAFNPVLRRRVENMICGPYPRVFDRKKIIFIHIPKTAGKSVEKAIGVRGSVHLLYREYEAIIGDRISNYDCFSVVRNPYTRLVSAYAYLIRGGNNSVADIRLADTFIRPAGSLDGFVKKSLACLSGQGVRIFRPQTDFLTAINGEIADIDILHFENLDADFHVVATRLGIDPVLKKTNKSFKSGLKLSLSDDALEIVYQIYARDFRFLGYDRRN